MQEGFARRLLKQAHPMPDHAIDRPDLDEIEERLRNAKGLVSGQSVAADLSHVIAYARGLERRQRWIPVGERLPGDYQRVLALQDFRHIGADVGTELLYRESGTWKDASTCDKVADVCLTHWMPLPAPPPAQEK